MGVSSDETLSILKRPIDPGHSPREGRLSARLRGGDPDSPLRLRQTRHRRLPSLARLLSTPGGHSSASFHSPFAPALVGLDRTGAGAPASKGALVTLSSCARSGVAPLPLRAPLPCAPKAPALLWWSRRDVAPWTMGRRPPASHGRTRNGAPLGGIWVNSSRCSLRVSHCGGRGGRRAGPLSRL